MKSGEMVLVLRTSSQGVFPRWHCWHCRLRDDDHVSVSREADQLFAYGRDLSYARSAGRHRTIDPGKELPTCNKAADKRSVTGSASGGRDLGGRVQLCSQQTGRAGCVAPRRNAAAEAELREHMTQLQSGIEMRGRPREPNRRTRLISLAGQQRHVIQDPWHQRAVDYWSECFIRLHPFDQFDDISDLYKRTPIGTRVLVLATAYSAPVASGR